MTVLGALLLIAPLLMACSTDADADAGKMPLTATPSINYPYHGDPELLSINNAAILFCAKTSSVISIATISGFSWTKSAHFLCAAPSAAPQGDGFDIDQSHPFLRDPGLLDVAGSASRYCVSHGFQQLSSLITMDEDGHKFVKFDCISKKSENREAMTQ